MTRPRMIGPRKRRKRYKPKVNLKRALRPFRKGDRVKMVKTVDGQIAKSFGTILSEEGDDLFLVKFDKREWDMHGPDGRCWDCWAHCLELVNSELVLKKLKEAKPLDVPSVEKYREQLGL